MAANKSFEKLKEKADKVNEENMFLKSASDEADKKLKVVEIKIENLMKREQKMNKENKGLREKNYEIMDTFEESKTHTLEDQLKVKHL